MFRLWVMIVNIFDFDMLLFVSMTVALLGLANRVRLIMLHLMSLQSDQLLHQEFKHIVPVLDV